MSAISRSKNDFAKAKVLPSAAASLAVLAAALLASNVATAAEETGRWQEVENKKGCLVWNAAPKENETVIWSGKCLDGRAHGYGQSYWRYQLKGDWQENSYTGTMKLGMPDGQGVYIWAYGNRYEGQWKNGKPDGRGIYIWSYGDRYDGQYTRGRPNGKGTFTSADGKSYSGNWSDGCFKKGDQWATVGTTRSACGF